MKRDNIVRLFALIAAIILLASALHAQSTATVQGTVLDTRNAAVPDGRRGIGAAGAVRREVPVLNNADLKVRRYGLRFHIIGA